MTKPTDLNSEQLAAAHHPLGRPAILLAGAGSGKTKTLTARVAWLLAQDIPANKILAITFTNKAADELRNRIGRGTDPKLDPRISTIHSLALGAIRRDPEGFGLRRPVSPIDERDAEDLLRRLLDPHQKADSLYADLKPWMVLEKVQYHRARNIGFRAGYTDAVHLAATKAHKGYHAMTEQELVLWGEYEKAKLEASVVDFDDMLHLVVRRGKTDDAWREKLQRTFKYVLVDEGQDVSPVQWAFIELLMAPDNLDLFTVGDLSQSIYAFNGAAPEILSGMIEGWRGTQPDLYRLENNYRSGSTVVRFANKVQQGMTETVPLQMNSMRRDAAGEPLKGDVRLIRASSPKEVAQSIAEKIQHENGLKTGQFKYRDNCILVRSGKSQVRDIEAELVKARVPYVVRGGFSMMQTEEARDLLAYLKAAVNPKDVTAFARAVSVPSRGVGDVMIEKLRTQAGKQFDGSLVAAAAAGDHVKLKPFGEFLQTLAGYEDVSQALRRVVNYTNYMELIQKKYGKKAPEKVEAKSDTIQRIIEAIANMQATVPGTTMSDIVFQLTMHQRDSTEPEGVVVVSTIHSAKGLEWPRVFVTNLYEGSLPHQYSVTDREVEEERRLFYVAITRARDAVYLCLPAMLQYGPNVRNVEPSRFLTELKIL